MINPTLIRHDFDASVAPCPFCGAGEWLVDPKELYSPPGIPRRIRITVTHFCEDSDGAHYQYTCWSLDDAIRIANKRAAVGEPSLIDEIQAIAGEVPDEEWDKLPRDFAENFRKVVTR